MFLLSLTSMVSMARDSIVTARQRCQIEARDKAELLIPLTPSYLDGITSTTGWDNNWFIETKGGASAFIGTPIGCGDLFDRVMPVLQIGFLTEKANFLVFFLRKITILWGWVFLAMARCQ